MGLIRFFFKSVLMIKHTLVSSLFNLQQRTMNHFNPVGAFYAVVSRGGHYIKTGFNNASM